VESLVSVENPVAIIREHSSHRFVVNKAAAPPLVRRRWELIRTLAKYFDRATGHARRNGNQKVIDRLTAYGHFKPTELPMIEQTFEHLPVQGRTVFVLGSGAGTELATAVIYEAARVVGIEADEDLVDETREILRDLGQEPLWVKMIERITVYAVSFFSDQISLKNADIICYTDCGSFGEGHLESKLRAEMKPGALLVVFQAPRQRITPLFQHLSRIEISGVPSGVEIYRQSIALENQAVVPVIQAPVFVSRKSVERAA
jgi:hypothetical protein